MSRDPGLVAVHGKRIAYEDTEVLSAQKALVRLGQPGMTRQQMMRACQHGKSSHIKIQNTNRDHRNTSRDLRPH